MTGDRRWKARIPGFLPGHMHINIHYRKGDVEGACSHVAHPSFLHPQQGSEAKRTCHQPQPQRGSKHPPRLFRNLPSIAFGFHFLPFWLSKMQFMRPSSRMQLGLPWWLSGKESPADAEDVGLIPGSERSSGEGNGNRFQHCCLGSPMDRGAWGTIVLRSQKCWTGLKD